MIKLLQELYARYSSGAPDKYRPDGIVQGEWYQVVGFKTAIKKINIVKDNVANPKEIEELSIGVISENKRLVFFTSQNAEMVCQESAAEKQKKLIGINQEEISKVKSALEESGKEWRKLMNLVDQIKK